jgi:hypothetical protein
MKLKTFSMYRGNGGVKAKRMYGSSTLTTFVVFRPEDDKDASRWVTVKDVGGKTPGERSTRAKEIAEPLLREKLKTIGIEVS